jgi:hypothetical protein
MWRKNWKRIVLLPIFAMALAACNQAGTSDHHRHAAGPSSVNTLSGDLREETAADKLPSFLKDHDPRVVAVYQAAAKHPELLEKIPCFCGCGKSAGHRSNKSCFIHDEKPDGRLVWDSHGVGCGVCQQIAMESVQMKEQGKSVKEIRGYIDQKYKEGFAEPTPTPMPEE